MRHYAVIDTNVLVSAMLKYQSVPGQIANEALLGDLIPLLCDEIIEEYREVLARPKFKFDQKTVEILIDGCVEYINKNVRVNRTASSSLVEGAVYLSAYRSSADRVNTNNIKKHKNDDTYRVVEAVPARGKSLNDINDSDYPVTRCIILYLGMPVMTVINTENYANGTCGVIIEIKDDSITMRTNEGKDIDRCEKRENSSEK